MSAHLIPGGQRQPGRLPRAAQPLRRPDARSWSSAAAVAAWLGLATASHAAVYTITPIPTVGGITSFGHGINEAGLVAGYAANALGQNRAILFDGVTSTDLGTLGGVDSQAFAINDAGQIAGYSKLATGQERAFRYSGGTMTSLGTLGGTSSYAFGINSTGQVAGGSTTQLDSAYRAFRYTGTTMQDLGSMGGVFGSSEGAGIDDDGSVVGYTSITFTSQQGFVHRNGIMTLLGTLGGNYSYAQAIKNGVIVGGAFLPGDTAFRATRWSDGTIANLGVLPGQPSSIAYGLNATGQIVGKSDAGTPESERAFLHLGQTMIDLNDLVPAGSGWVLRQARGINSAGQVVGFGTLGGQTRGFRLELAGKIWSNPAGGAWGTGANWFSAGTPAAAQAVAFPLAATYAVQVPGNATSGTLLVSRGRVTLEVAPSATLALSGPADVRANAELTASGGGSLAGTTLRVASGGTFTVRGGSTASWDGVESQGTIRAGEGGVLRLVGTGPAVATAGLVVDGSTGAWTGRVDVGTRSVVVDYSGTSPLPTVADQVRTARGSGDWAGNGISSSSADASSLAVGYADAAALFSQFPASFGGRPVDSTALLLRLTRYGDANLDGTTNIADFSALAANFNTPGPWSSGDFDYDGVVGIADFSLLAANFNTSVAASGEAGRPGVGAPAAVPEPATSAAAAALAAALLAGRRRGRAGRESRS